MLIATAGHVDHGKTSLVRALTGVDTDRLPEEKKRGVSIDLGFAYDNLGSDRSIGFIDVPGHEKFVRNMLAGVGAVDAVLLVVAADDGPMPQTREHLAILNLLGIGKAVVALTRVDLVSADQLQAARDACLQLLAGTTFADAPIHAVSALTGAGIEGLRAQLAGLAAAAVSSATDERFRLAIDRQFTVPGSGLIVTGSVFSGRLAVGDSVHLAPHGATARVRGLHVQNQSSELAVAGVRCAVNLNANDLGRVQPQRGDWLVGDPGPLPTRRLDVELQLLASEARPMAHWTPVHLHHGAGAFGARVALLDQRQVEPGQTALAQLVLDSETVAVRSDRLILRDQSARRTVAGGVVIDPFGPARGRSRATRLALLQTIKASEADDALSALLAANGAGVDTDWLAQTWNLTPDRLEQMLATTPSQLVTVTRGHSLTSQVRIAPARWQQLGERLVQQVSDWHQQYPDQPGPIELDMRRALAETAPRELCVACVAELIGRGTLVRQGPRLRLAQFRPQQTARQQAFWKKLTPYLDATVTRPPVVTELAKKLNLSKPDLEQFLSDAAQRGELVRFAANRYFHPEALAQLAAIASDLGSQHPQGFDARAFRDASGIGRNLTIEVLEYFDSRQLTRRVGDRRRLIGDAGKLFGSPSAQSRKDQ